MEEELAMEGKEAWRMEEGKEWTVEEGKDGVWNLRGKILKKPSKQKWMLTTETVFCEVPGIFLGADVQMEEWGGGWRCFLYALTAYISQMCLHSNWEQAPSPWGAGKELRALPSVTDMRGWEARRQIQDHLGCHKHTGLIGCCVMMEDRTS